MLCLLTSLPLLPSKQGLVCIPYVTLDCPDNPEQYHPDNPTSTSHWVTVGRHEDRDHRDEGHTPMS